MRNSFPSAVLMSLMGPLDDAFDEPAIRICCVLPPGLCMTTICPGTAFVVLMGFGAIFVRVIGTIDFSDLMPTNSWSFVGDDSISSWNVRIKFAHFSVGFASNLARNLRDPHPTSHV